VRGVSLGSWCGGVTAVCGAGLLERFLTSIAILGVPTAPLNPGQSVQLTATGTYSDASARNITSAVSWSASAGNVVAVSPRASSRSGCGRSRRNGDAVRCQRPRPCAGVARRRRQCAVPRCGAAQCLACTDVGAGDPRVCAANDILLQKTGERMKQTDLANIGPGFVLSQATAYVNAHASDPPDGCWRSPTMTQPPPTAPTR